VVITANVTTLTADYDPSHPKLAIDRVEPVVIEDYAFVATSAMILRGVRLGYGAMVGAGSVVTRSVDAYCIVADSPARPIGRSPEGLSYTASYKRNG
jgi:acetyltransferase-like isoleucine patch superfamily enzyme